MKKCTLLLLALLLIVIGCEKNQAPQITSIESRTEIIVGGSEVVLKVNSSDENGDSLTYNWSANGGEIISTTTSDSLVWKAPESISEDSYTITVEVSDGELTAENELSVSVEGSKYIDLRDDNIYTFVQIEDQIWMAENLAYLPYVSHPYEGSDDDPYCYVYDYKGTSISPAKATDNYDNYGVLYNWASATSDTHENGQDICPTGWHLPTDNEWTVLTDYLTNNGFGVGGSGSDIGKSMASTSGWSSSYFWGEVGNDQTSNNSSGFNALPGGYRHSNGGFAKLGTDALFWSSSSGGSNALYRTLIYDYGGVRLGNSYCRNGFSIRCIKDE